MEGLPPRTPLPTIGANWFPSSDCNKNNIPTSMRDRARDISAVLDRLPGWFGGRVDNSRAGLAGHSRGTVSALVAAGGSSAWGIDREPRVKAIMGFGIGAPNVTTMANLASVTVPALFVYGAEDDNPPEQGGTTATGVADVVDLAHNTIQSADKRVLAVADAVHRSFGSTYCEQLQSSAAAFDADGDGTVEAGLTGGPNETVNARKVLDRFTVSIVAASIPMFQSGKAAHYCAHSYFTGPVNIEQMVASITNSEYACSVLEGTVRCTVAPRSGQPQGPDTGRCATVVFTVPCTGLDSPSCA
jgi:hypothetical protein